ncbi:MULTISPECIES: response regulator transcription factor [Aeromonas]|uniref:Transcriptional regulator n=1 Tax=Aeromonas schubertii TaxID=652 RepID=A0A0S2SIR2_9GAMM|nr:MULTISPECIES: response regulator transcription factor [Aeromonas]ALP41590.1 transcriptional regulator [Aeromonas schubertii]VXA81197.1 Sensory transduction protein regX3 [Aeromonas salmonicida]
MKTILLIEDEVSLAENLQRYLSREGYRCLWCKTLVAAEAQWLAADLVLLDRTMPEGDSLDRLPQWLARKALPVIVLTARVEVSDRVAGLDAGARDYLTKPFSHDELLARVRAQLRQLGDGAQTVGGLQLYPARMQASWHGEMVSFTPTEFALLTLLARMVGRVLSREEILNRVWGYQAFPSTRTVDTHILQLRQKLPGLVIETVRGIGYRLEGAE